MKYSKTYIRSKKEVKKQDSVNATLLVKAGYVSQVSSGVYALLPLGLRSVEKIKAIIREELAKVDATEMLMTSLTSKEMWQKSGRWDDQGMKEIFYYTDENSMALAPTHEEEIAMLLSERVQSYNDLPIALYQFQTKFRKELRAKSGLLRGREFMMKDLYSLHTDEQDRDLYYEKVSEAYLKIFDRLGLKAYRVKASGGVFMKELSDEYQVLSETGEDEIIYDDKTMTGYNVEVEDKFKDKIEGCKRGRSIEVGNIFKLGDKYCQAFDMEYLDAEGQRHVPTMASYGIGVTRLLGAIAEVSNDENGLKMPVAVAPYTVFAIDLTKDERGSEIIAELEKSGVDVLIDDRQTTAGDKFVESDLLGIPYRLVISDKTLSQDKYELKDRMTGAVTLLTKDELLGVLTKID